MCMRESMPAYIIVKSIIIFTFLFLCELQTHRECKRCNELRLVNARMAFVQINAKCAKSRNQRYERHLGVPRV